MSSQEVVEAVAAWVRDVLPEVVEASAYDYMPEGKASPLPDAVVDLTAVTMAVEDPRFPFVPLEQTWLRIFGLTLSLMVENGAPATAAEQLRDFTDRLSASLLDGGTLGRCAHRLFSSWNRGSPRTVLR